MLRSETTVRQDSLLQLCPDLPSALAVLDISGPPSPLDSKISIHLSSWFPFYTSLSRRQSGCVYSKARAAAEVRDRHFWMPRE